MVTKTAKNTATKMTTILLTSSGVVGPAQMSGVDVRRRLHPFPWHRMCRVRRSLPQFFKWLSCNELRRQPHVAVLATPMGPCRGKPQHLGGEPWSIAVNDFSTRGCNVGGSLHRGVEPIVMNP